MFGRSRVESCPCRRTGASPSSQRNKQRCPRYRRCHRATSEPKPSATCREASALRQGTTHAWGTPSTCAMPRAAASTMSMAKSTSTSTLAHGAAFLGYNHPVNARGHDCGSGRGHSLRLRDRSTYGPSTADHRDRPLRRARSLRQYRFRGDDGLCPLGPRPHRQAQDSQILGALSWPLRLRHVQCAHSVDASDSRQLRQAVW